MHQTNFIVLSNPIPGRETEYNEWYTNHHLPDLLAVPGILSAQRFISVETEREPRYAYLAIYEVSDPESAIQGIAERRGTPRLILSSAFDTARSTSVYLKPVASRRSDESRDAGAEIALQAMTSGITDGDLSAKLLQVMLDQSGGHAAQLFEKTAAQPHANVIYRHVALTHVDDALEAAGRVLKNAGSIDAAFLTEGIATENRFLSFFRPITKRLVSNSIEQGGSRS